MNRYSIEELFVGQSYSFFVRIEEEEMDSFRNMTGDYNPLHNNDEFAKRKGYKGRVVYGLLSTSFFSTLVGMYLPGENCLIEEVSYKFMKPTFVGDEIEVCGEIIQIDKRTSQVFIRVRIKDNEKRTLIRGKMVVGVI